MISHRVSNIAMITVIRGCPRQDNVIHGKGCFTPADPRMTASYPCVINALKSTVLPYQDNALAACPPAWPPPLTPWRPSRSWRSGSFWGLQGMAPSLCLSSLSSIYRPAPGCLDTLATCCSRSPTSLTCLACLRRNRVWIASVRDDSPHLSASPHSRSRSSRMRFSTDNASLQGAMGSTGESGHSHLGASMAVGLLRPPRVTRYFSSQRTSVRHSQALFPNSLRACQLSAPSPKRERMYIANPWRQILDREQSAASLR